MKEGTTNIRIKNKDKDKLGRLFPDLSYSSSVSVVMDLLVSRPDLFRSISEVAKDKEDAEKKKQEEAKEKEQQPNQPQAMTQRVDIENLPYSPKATLEALPWHTNR